MGVFDTTAAQFASKISSVVSGAGQVAGNFAQAARNIGVAASTILGNKPDGTPILTTALKSALPKGLAEAIMPGASQPGATIDPNIDFSIETDFSYRKRYQTRGKRNELEKFASYNVLFTMAALTKEQANNPFSYRGNPSSLTNVVFSSAGRFEANRVNTAYTNYAPEYYVNGFSITSIPTATEAQGVSLQTNIEFEIYEPYSMGLFLQSLQIAAINSGQPNYLNGTPYVIVMEFTGFDQWGNSIKPVKPKYFVVTLRNTTFKTDEAGSKYVLQAIPYNLQGFSSVINNTYNDIALTGNTVKEVLTTSERSLCIALNEQEIRKVGKDGKKVADVYEIHFPEAVNSPIALSSPISEAVKRATLDPQNETVLREAGKSYKNAPDFGDNAIGGAGFGFSPSSGGNFVYTRASDAIDPKTGVVVRETVTIDPKKRTFQYAQGQTITAIITQTVLSSEYATEAIKEENFVTPEGYVKWFRIDVQIQLTEWDESLGQWGKRIIYRVLPYLVHCSVFSNTGAVPPGYSEIAKSIVKEYNYIYTGQNVDVLKFDIDINNAFFTAIAPVPQSDSGKLKNPDQESGGETPVSKAEKTEGSAGVNATAGAKTGGVTAKPSQDLKLPFGGSGNLTTEQIVANNFHAAFLQNVTNMVGINIEVLGDPYWISDSGQGGYFAGPGETAMINSDGNADYDGGDTYVFLRFRTPIEPEHYAGFPPGTFQFPPESESPFSGIYKVTKVISTVRDGLFKQAITGIRMNYQINDFDTPLKPITKDVMQYKTQEVEPTPSGFAGSDDNAEWV